MKGKPIIVPNRRFVFCICGRTVQMQPVDAELYRQGWALRAECPDCDRHYSTLVKDVKRGG